MTQASVVNHRGGLWVAELQNWGYEIRTSAEAVSGNRHASLPGLLTVVGVRRSELGEPAVTITVRELWLPGADPSGLSPRVEGCFCSLARGMPSSIGPAVPKLPSGWIWIPASQRGFAFTVTRSASPMASVNTRPWQFRRSGFTALRR